MTHSVWVGIPL